MSDMIIVTAHPETVALGNETMSTGVTAAQGQVAALSSTIASKQNASVDPDVNDEEIVVIANKIENTIATLFVVASLYGPPISLPCIGATTKDVIVMTLYNLRINATNKTFGPGSAGENLVGEGGPSSSEVLVNTNVDALKGYDAIGGGLDYLVLHEVAHALPSMQAFDKQMWEEYLAGPGQGLTLEEQRAGYHASEQFKANEARANTVAKALAELYGRPTLAVTPTNGYASC